MFGEYLVKPMASVLFFDFGTKTALGVSIPFVVVWLLCAGVFLTLRMGFINLRGFWHAIELVRGKYDDKDHQGDVSHFQALSSALSGTVGLGNIAGVAIAIGVGGPGATFWMIVSGFLGMTSKFAECTLAVMYRSKDEQGLVLGGPMVYLREGLGKMGLGWLGSVLAIVFTFLCIGGSFGGGNSYQVAQSLNALKTEPAFAFLEDYPWVYGLIMTVLVGVVIIGGIKSIGNFAGAVVLAVRGARNRDGGFQSNSDVRWFFGCYGDRHQTGCVFQRSGCWLSCDRTLRSQNRQTHQRRHGSPARTVYRYSPCLHVDRFNHRLHRCLSSTGCATIGGRRQRLHGDFGCVHPEC